MSTSAEDWLERIAAALAAEGGAAAASVAAAAVAEHPGSPRLHHARGNVLLALGDRDAAEGAFERALSLDPASQKTLNNLANLRLEAGQPAEALAIYERALGLRPSARLHGNAARCLLGLGRGDAAHDHAAAACRLDPASEAAALTLARALSSTGDEVAALAELERARLRFPASAAVANDLGACLTRLGRQEDALAALRSAAASSPGDPVVLTNLGDALRRAGALDEAWEALEHGAALRPDRPELALARGALLLEIGDATAAAAAFQAAAAAATGVERFERSSMRLFAMSHGDAFDGRRLLEEARLAAQLLAPDEPAIPRPRRAPRPPRVVYVSPDLRAHVVSVFLEPVLAAHDPGRIELVLVSTTTARDAVTERIAGRFGLVDVGGADPRSARERVAALEADVLVDLAGHSGSPSLSWLTPRLAPVQASFLGYPGTTGLGAIDWKITDARADPAGVDDEYTERLARLPRSAWAYVPDPVSLPRPRRPGPPTFGSFHRAQKLSGTTLSLWGRLLERVPGARLLLRARALESAVARARALAPFERLGVADRVELRGHAARASDALAAYGEVDVALDPFPYHGTTTTCDALAMGVPVVSLAGPAPAARVARSLLSSVGLDDLVFDDPDAFLEGAAALALDGDRLARLRATLRGTLTASELGDPAGLARALEALYARWTGA